MANVISTDEGPVNPMNRNLPFPVLLAALPSLRANGNDAMLGALLGIAHRNRKRKRRVRLQAMKRKWRGLSPAERKKKLAAWLATQSAAKKSRLAKRLAAAAARRKALLARRAAAVKAAIKKSPKLRKRIVRRLLQKQLTAARDLPSDQSTSSVPQGEVPSPPAANAPAESPVQDDFHPTPAETVEKASDDSAENAYEDSAEAAEKGAEAATDEVESEAVEATESEESAESMTEPTAEENAQEAEATVNEDEEDEGAEASEDESSAGASLLGAIGHHMRKQAFREAVLGACLPTAEEIARVSKGNIPAQDTMRGCALISAAKGGNMQAKAAILGIKKAARKGNPKAKKAHAQLKVSHKVLKKARKKVVKARKPTAAKKRRPAKANLYHKQIPLIKRGLASYSAHQRGLAMIPAFARGQFRGVSGDE